jgi:hypothetical protein
VCAVLFQSKFLNILNIRKIVIIAKISSSSNRNKSNTSFPNLADVLTTLYDLWK